MKNHVRVLTVLMIVSLVQLSCSTKFVTEGICWNTGGMWFCDDEDCNTGHCERAESGKQIYIERLSEEEADCWDSGGEWIWDDYDNRIGHCGIRTYSTIEERECLTNGDIWIWDDEENLIGHCETLDFLNQATEDPVEEAVTEAPVEEEPSGEDQATGGGIQVGTPVDECDARELPHIESYLLEDEIIWDELAGKGYRSCHYNLTYKNSTDKPLIFSTHIVRYDAQYPDNGPIWNDTILNPDIYVENGGYYTEHIRGTYAGTSEYWYIDQIAVVDPACFDEKEYDYGMSPQKIPDEYIEMYAFNVPYFCSP